MSDNKAGLAIMDAHHTLSLDPRRAALAIDPFEPQTMPELYKFAEAVAATEFAPKEFKGKPNDCFVAMVYGRGLGLGALQSLQGIGVINGKPSVYGETFWALIISHPDFLDCVEDVSDERAEVTMTRKGRAPGTYSFSMVDAQLAGLKGKAGPWTQYPKGQMLWRARHRAATALFADALKGVLPREIAADYTIIEGERLPDPPALAAAAASSSAPAPAAKGDQPKPQADADPVISPDQVKQWNDAWSAGCKMADITEQKAINEKKRAALERFGVKRSGEMRASQFAISIAEAQALTVKPEAEAAAEQPQAQAEPKEKTAEELAREWMTGLNLSMFQQNTKIEQHTKNGETDWVKICLDLEPDAVRAGMAG
jgi:hypothetical protein